MLGLSASCLSPFFSPELFWPMAFFGLAFPLLTVINVFFFLYWLLVKNKKIAITQGVLLLLSMPYYPRHMQFFPKEISEDSLSTTLNVVDFNTHYMGAFDFEGKDSNFFFALLDTIQPDVMCFQEFTNLSGGFEKPMFKKFFSQFKEYANVNADALSNSFPTGYGVCIFSKYPIVKKGFLERVNQSSNLTVFADIVVGSDTIRVVNTHLKSIVFDKVDYKAVEDLKNIEEVESWEVRRIAAKLKYAFKARAVQADAIREKLIDCPYKIILCGDFNDSPNSYSYEILRGKLKDAFMQSGRGMSRTYVGKMPSFRIDYILHDPSFESYNYKTNRVNFSDHKMISCTIKLR